MTHTKLKVFDGFCKAGGAGAGYERAGYEVHSMDIAHQPRNRHRFRQGDVLNLFTSDGLDYLRQFDLLHFSPPCQGYTDMRSAPGAKGAPRLIPRVRALALAAGVPYVIENVRRARWAMLTPVSLYGDMFGLQAWGGRLLRERLFECSFPLQVPERKIDKRLPVIGVYGNHCRIRAKSFGGRGTRDPWPVPHKQVAGDLMGIGWMEMHELDEAVPPAYTQWIGDQFRARVAR